MDYRITPLLFFMNSYRSYKKNISLLHVDTPEYKLVDFYITQFEFLFNQLDETDQRKINHYDYNIEFSDKIKRVLNDLCELRDMCQQKYEREGLYGTCKPFRCFYNNILEGGETTLQNRIMCINMNFLKMNEYLN
jgi:hypothetical protein